ncbi:MAG: AAA family ATPase [Rhodospirillales bacterium]|nr:AAA family ATPase [Rhodospirillales bacterium]
MPPHRIRAKPRPGACSFCGERQPADPLLSAGEAAICAACAVAAAEVLRVDDNSLFRSLRHLPPAEIKRLLDEDVIGQDHAKRVLAVAVWNHHKRLFNRAIRGGVEVAKSNVLLIGSTGSGKTLLARSLAEVAGLPFATIDATTLTRTGYAGRDVGDIAVALVEAAGHDLELAEKGIVYIDEIDKLAALPDQDPGRPDIKGAGVQRSLLGLIEGRAASLDRGRRRASANDATLDTTNVLFICGGAFNGLKGASSRDLVEFGLLPELVGRLPVVVVLEPLGREDLVRILTEPRNALVEQYRALFRWSGVELEFTPDAIEEIAARALARGLGARGLRAVMETVLLDEMFELSDSPERRRLVVDRAFVAARLDASQVCRDSRWRREPREAFSRS